MVCKVIAGHRRQHHVAQAHGLDGIGDPLRLRGVHGHGGHALVDLAERATAGADRATEQEGRRSCRVALASVGTAALFADGVQPVAFHQALDGLKFGGIADRTPQPFRKAFAGGDGAVLTHARP